MNILVLKLNQPMETSMGGGGQVKHSAGHGHSVRLMASQPIHPPYIISNATREAYYYYFQY